MLNLPISLSLIISVYMRSSGKSLRRMRHVSSPTLWTTDDRRRLSRAKLTRYSVVHPAQVLRTRGLSFYVDPPRPMPAAGDLPTQKVSLRCKAAGTMAHSCVDRKQI